MIVYLRTSVQRRTDADSMFFEEIQNIICYQRQVRYQRVGDVLFSAVRFGIIHNVPDDSKVSERLPTLKFKGKFQSRGLQCKIHSPFCCVLRHFSKVRLVSRSCLAVDTLQIADSGQDEDV